MCRNTQSWKHTNSPGQVPCPGIKWGCEHKAPLTGWFICTTVCLYRLGQDDEISTAVFTQRKKQDLHTQFCRRTVTQTYLQGEDSGLLGCDTVLTLISGFRRDVDEICCLLGNYTASCGNLIIHNYHTKPCNYTEDHRCDTVLLGVQFLMFQIIVVPSLSKKEVFILD